MSHPLTATRAHSRSPRLHMYDPSPTMIELGHFLPGGAPLTSDKGVNETYKGVIEVGQATLSAYVKLLPDRQLVNELFASVLGRLAQLPVPRGFLVQVQRADYPTSALLQAQGVQTMPAFAVETISYQSLMRRVDLQSIPARMRLFREWPNWYAAASFDDWIANADRHPGNLLVGAKGEVWLIDHSHCFMGDKWVAPQLDPNAVTGNQLCAAMSAWLTPAEKALALQQCHASVQRFSSIDAQRAANLALLVNLLNATDLGALTSFVTTRAPTIATRLSASLGVPYLPLEN
jgi:hypothetical protein